MGIFYCNKYKICFQATAAPRTPTPPLEVYVMQPFYLFHKRNIAYLLPNCIQEEKATV